MAASKNIPLTAEEKSRANAAQIVALRHQKAQLEEEITGLEDELRAYVLETGEKVIGPLMAYERQNPPKLVGATGKKLEVLVAQLTKQLPEEFWKRKLELTTILASIDSDANLRAQLLSKGLSIEQGSGWHFKVIEN